MRLFRLAVEEQRWDLAVHTLVLAAARLLNEVAVHNTSKLEKRTMPRKPETKEKNPKTRPKARRAGFYSKVLDEAEQIDFDLAAGVNGIDDEIALLRVKIKSILASNPDDVKNIMHTTNALARLVKIRYDISKEQKKGLKDAIGNVIKDIALPLGIGIGTGIKKQ